MVVESRCPQQNYPESLLPGSLFSGHETMGFEFRLPARRQGFRASDLEFTSLHPLFKFCKDSFHLRDDLSIEIIG